MSLKYVLTAAVVLGFAGTAIAADAGQFVIIKDKNQNCRVVDTQKVDQPPRRNETTTDPAGDAGDAGK